MFFCLQILHYKVQLLLAAETVREKRIRFTKLLNWSQVALVLLNIVHFALNCHSAVLNVAAMNHFLKSAQAFRSGSTATGARLFLESLELYNDPSDYYQGVSQHAVHLLHSPPCARAPCVMPPPADFSLD
jgi:hypothetical protein